MAASHSQAFCNRGPPFHGAKGALLLVVPEALALALASTGLAGRVLVVWCVAK